MTFATLTDRQADRLLDLALDGESAERIVELAAAELGVDAETAGRIVQEMHDHPIARIVLAGTAAARTREQSLRASSTCSECGFVDDHARDCSRRDYYALGGRRCTNVGEIADHNAARADLWEKYPDGEGDPC